jgi:hypothetical protein
MHPDEFLTLIVYDPFPTCKKVVPLWKVTPSKLYSNPGPVGLVTVITASLTPSVQSTACVGLCGTGRDGLITTLEVAVEVHPTSFVTVKLYVPAVSPDKVVLEPEPVI